MVWIYHLLKGILTISSLGFQTKAGMNLYVIDTYVCVDWFSFLESYGKYFYFYKRLPNSFAE